MKNSVINSHKPNKNNAICLILDLSFWMSYTNQKLMSGIIINILEREVKKKKKKVIKMIIDVAISLNSEKKVIQKISWNKIFLHRETSILLKKKSRKDFVWIPYFETNWKSDYFIC